MTASFAFDTPDDALRALVSKLSVVPGEGRSGPRSGAVLAESAVADRDSPAADVSAMDGYAIRLEMIRHSERIPVSGESLPGSPPPVMKPGAVVRIFTGAVVPAGCDAIVKREDTLEQGGEICWRPGSLKTSAGDHIRRVGENIRRGDIAIRRGVVIGAAEHALLTHFGYTRCKLHRPVRVSLLTTGDEVLRADASPEPWQLRNSNRAALESMLEGLGWVDVVTIGHASDERAALQASIENAVGDSDATILTGGVSMGDYDFVPEIIRKLGAEVVFHKLPIRPGKPILGAATADGKLILGLPGNPVSATIGCQRFAVPLLAKMSGQTDWLKCHPLVNLANPGEKTLPLHWLRAVKLIEHGVAEVVPSRGSGDLVALAGSSGFVEIPPHKGGVGPWPYHAWL